MIFAAIFGGLLGIISICGAFFKEEIYLAGFFLLAFGSIIFSGAELITFLFAAGIGSLCTMLFFSFCADFFIRE